MRGHPLQSLAKQKIPVLRLKKAERIFCDVHSSAAAKRLDLLNPPAHRALVNPEKTRNLSLWIIVNLHHLEGFSCLPRWRFVMLVKGDTEERGAFRAFDALGSHGCPLSLL
jgi:hypothetical protein